MIVGLPEIEIRLRTVRVVLDDQLTALERLVGAAQSQIALDGMCLQREATMFAVIVVVRVLDFALGAFHHCPPAPALSRRGGPVCKPGSGAQPSREHGARAERAQNWLSSAPVIVEPGALSRPVCMD